MKVKQLAKLIHFNKRKSLSVLPRTKNEEIKEVLLTKTPHHQSQNGSFILAWPMMTS